jgi:hypothetical protein
LKSGYSGSIVNATRHQAQVFFLGGIDLSFSQRFWAYASIGSSTIFTKLLRSQIFIRIPVNCPFIDPTGSGFLPGPDNFTCPQIGPPRAFTSDCPPCRSNPRRMDTCFLIPGCRTSYVLATQILGLFSIPITHKLFKNPFASSSIKKLTEVSEVHRHRTDLIVSNPPREESVAFRRVGRLISYDQVKGVGKTAYHLVWAVTAFGVIRINMIPRECFH